MAKAAVKPATEKVATKKVAPKTTKSTPKAKPALDAAAKDALNKLISLKIDQQLQADLEWCIGSYLHDQNPVGLIENLEKAIAIFKTELARKTKGITAKFIADLEKALNK